VSVLSTSTARDSTAREKSEESPIETTLAGTKYEFEEEAAAILNPGA
jgi:hypothetical protein